MRTAAALEDIEEIPDWYVHRPIARHLVRWLLPTPISPNQVTAMSAIAGIAASLALLEGIASPPWRLVSAALLVFSTILDCVDGQLARARTTMSRGGTTLDTIADVIVAVTVMGSATIFLGEFGEFPLRWIVTIAALASYAAQCFFFDIAKERYLAGHGLRYASSKSVLAAQPAAAATDRPNGGVLFTVFDRYWEFARRLAVVPSSTTRVSAMSSGRMRAWTFLGQGTHMAALYIALALSTLWPGVLYACMLVFALMMNGLMMVLIATDSPARQ